MDHPNLRKKHVANDKKRGKVFVYNSKFIRIREHQLMNRISKK